MLMVSPYDVAYPAYSVVTLAPPYLKTHPPWGSPHYAEAAGLHIP